LGIRARAGHHIHTAVDVQDIYMAGSLHPPINAFCSP